MNQFDVVHQIEDRVATVAGQTLEYGEHQLGISGWIVHHTHAETIVHHVEEGFIEQGLGQFAKIVLEKT